MQTNKNFTLTKLATSPQVFLLQPDYSGLLNRRFGGDELSGCFFDSGLLPELDPVLELFRLKGLAENFLFK